MDNNRELLERLRAIVQQQTAPVPFPPYTPGEPLVPPPTLPPDITGPPVGLVPAFSVEDDTVSTADTVDHPAHYSQWPMEPIEFIAVNDLPWWLANLVKYGMRYNMKDGIKDLYKARSYLDMKIRQLEGHPRFWDKPVTTERRLNAGQTV